MQPFDRSSAEKDLWKNMAKDVKVSGPELNQFSRDYGPTGLIAGRQLTVKVGVYERMNELKLELDDYQKKDFESSKGLLASMRTGDKSPDVKAQVANIHVQHVQKFQRKQTQAQKQEKGSEQGQSMAM